MGYVYEFNICKFDLEFYKLVDVNFMVVSCILIIFFEFIRNLFFFKNLKIRCLIVFY